MEKGAVCGVEKEEHWKEREKEALREKMKRGKRVWQGKKRK